MHTQPGSAVAQCQWAVSGWPVSQTYWQYPKATQHYNMSYFLCLANSWSRAACDSPSNTHKQQSLQVISSGKWSPTYEIMNISINAHSNHPFSPPLHYVEEACSRPDPIHTSVKTAWFLQLQLAIHTCMPLVTPKILHHPCNMLRK